MIRLILYGTSGCQLCDQAHAILAQVARSNPLLFEVEWIDIAADPDLTDRYGTRIPVIRDSRSHQELGWPFDSREVADFLSGKESQPF